MTEQEWLSETPPEEWLLTAAVVQFLHGRTSDRKLRLFAVACCRRIQHLLDDERSRAAIEVAERHADGLASDDELARAERNAADLSDGDEGNCEADMARAAAAYVAAKDVVTAVDTAFNYSMGPSLDPDDGNRDGVRFHSENMLRWAFLHDIVGNPFRPAAIDQSWLTSNVSTLAQAAYEERAFDRMAILADALEDAGCTNQEILGHCRGAGPHVRGCWVLDLLLGRI